jgi:ankyrin repeat protein
MDYIKRHNIEQSYQQSSKAEISFTPTSKFNQSVDQKVVELRDLLREKRDKPDDELILEIKDTGLSLESYKFNIITALRMLEDVIAHKKFGDRYHVNPEDKVTNGLRIKDILAFCYDALSDDENLVASNPDDKRVMMVRFITFLKEVRREYNGQDDNSPDINKCAGGTVNHLVYALNGLHKSVDVAVIPPKALEAEATLQINELALIDYQAKPRPEGLEAELKKWQMEGKPPASLINRYKEQIAGKFKELYDKYFISEQHYLNDLVKDLNKAQISQKLDSELAAGSEKSVNEYAKLIKAWQLPLFKKVGDKYQLTLLDLMETNPELYNNLQIIMLNQDWSEFLLYLSPDKVELSEALRRDIMKSIYFMIEYHIDDEFVNKALTASQRTLSQEYKNEILSLAFEANNPSICALALGIGASPYISPNETYLHKAVAAGNSNMVNALLSKLPIAVINAKDSENETALHIAVRKGDAELARALLAKEGIDVNATDRHGQMVLHYAVTNGHTEIVEALLEKMSPEAINSARYGETALHWAAANGRTAIVSALLKKMSLEAINLANEFGETALYFAALKGHTEIVNALLEQMSLEAINHVNGSGETALHGPAKNGDKTIVNALLAKMSSKAINLANKSGETALSIAIEREFTEIAIALLEKVSPAAINNGILYDKTALHLAANKGRTAIVKALLAKEGIDVNTKDMHGHTALHEAAYYGYTEIVKALLTKEGIDVTAKDNYGYTAAQRANRSYAKGVAEVVKMLRPYEQNKLLLPCAIGISAVSTTALAAAFAVTALTTVMLPALGIGLGVGIMISAVVMIAASVQYSLNKEIINSHKMPSQPA